MKKQVFWEKTLSSFLKAYSTKMEGAKYLGDSRVACLICLSYPLSLICVGLNANLAVVLLQMHCQMKLRRSPCSVFPCFKPEVATSFWAEIVFFLWTPRFNVGLQNFEGLHQYRFSFLYRNLLVWWHFRLAACHFTDSSLKWSFSWFPEQTLVLEEVSDFSLRHIL